MRVKGRLYSKDNREILTAVRTYYVRADGNDSNAGLADSAGGAFLTLQRAIDIYQGLDCNGYDVTISIGDGTYTVGARVTARIGAGDLYLTGNASTPANVFINASADCFDISGHPSGSSVYINGFKLVTSAGNGITSQGGSKVNFLNINFGSVSGTHLVCAGGGSTLTATGNYVITGGGFAHILANPGGWITLNTVTVAISGNPTFTFFVLAQFWSLLLCNSSVWSVTGTVTGQRYYSINYSIVATAEGPTANYFPGDSAGATATGGLYIN